ncbi:putative bifunctional diguanylate cyclase/phosphodiesterase [Granulicella sibirica]|uniref:Diguanylate cyclase/phosphodiesterase (GGDEF & EAL domains) with PAS/PAC sensor(S) n=1 Tax=Granulicella sibirica TaxID=2479048 RepID=A0A4Q0SZZ2_9BACT|nr:EAL domain-containing protein [Granulicella sibirica]RXH54801.1 diguanylate cyclase/phosphodiesterase (GGDEF & EAL domains) with PAS/PAC sensor(s) [Granulicella sibirica]
MNGFLLKELALYRSERAARNASAEVRAIFEREHERICMRSDKLIACLMLLQWPGAVLASFLISPTTWVGGQSRIHPHVIAAIALGGLITILPVTLAIFAPGKIYTRHIIAACQMLMSGLLIHVTGGRIETHFHVFGSLAFLCFYLDWPVLITATLTTLVNHLAMGYYEPIAIFGTAAGSHGRMLEHVLWVVFCDTFMITSCVQTLRGLWVTSHREAEQDVLLYQAYHDALTGLGNRLLIQKKLSVLLDDPSRKGSRFALLSIDLDRFKEVNDTLGHQAGDALLIQVSTRLQGLLRKDDVLARMGGDEFALLIDDCQSQTVAESVAARMIGCITTPFDLGQHEARIGASIGICLHPQEGLEAKDLFHHADLALYKVKNSGRNSFLVFDEKMRAETTLQMSLEHNLRTAVHEQLMEVYYQPIVDAMGLVLGFEALLRWHDSVHGQVSPAQFIPIAERNGLIVPLGNWVLAQACAQAAEWRRQGNKLSKMSVNVSSAQLSHDKFVGVVLATLKETGLPPELLDLELTEGVMIENHGQTQQTLELLRKFGVRLSIDDFGTGYSSLSYLRELPVHTLKIDRAFVTDIEHSIEARTLVEGMIDMARSLNLRIVAEGVENRQQMDILIAAGCDQIQGFHISKAVPAEAAGRLMAVKEPTPERQSLAVWNIASADMPA